MKKYKFTIYTFHKGEMLPCWSCGETEQADRSTAEKFVARLVNLLTTRDRATVDYIIGEVETTE